MKKGVRRRSQKGGREGVSGNELRERKEGEKKTLGPERNLSAPFHKKSHQIGWTQKKE